jgi:hypothetical protein
LVQVAVLDKRLRTFVVCICQDDLNSGHSGIAGNVSTQVRAGVVGQAAIEDHEIWLETIDHGRALVLAACELELELGALALFPEALLKLNAVCNNKDLLGAAEDLLIVGAFLTSRLAIGASESGLLRKAAHFVAVESACAVDQALRAVFSDASRFGVELPAVEQSLCMGPDCLGLLE